jgi:AGZA family xanthine/uracil permease-like MFS transporter
MVATATPPVVRGRDTLDRFFEITQRGSTVKREVRGGSVNVVVVAYIFILNPLILAAGHDITGRHLSIPQVASSTILVAAVTTLIMGLYGNMPLVLAAGLGVNGIVAFVIAPLMTWPDAMGLVVDAGILICVLSVTRVRQRIFDAVPFAVKQAIAVGIGLFITIIGFVQSGFVTSNVAGGTPVTLGTGGLLKGWPVFIFLVGLLITAVLVARRVPGAILISMAITTVLALFAHARGVTGSQWGLIEPHWPSQVVASPDFGLLGQFSLFGSFQHARVVTVIVLLFTVFLSDFFDAVGTITGITSEAGLLDALGRVPRFMRVLFTDGLGAVFGGGASASSSTSFIESAAGVGEGARTGLASVVTAVFFGVALFFTPIYAMVPQQAAAPALIVVGFLMMTRVVDIPWKDDWGIALPAFLTIVTMPFTYSITNGIGLGFISYALIRLCQGRGRDVKPFMWVVVVLFVAYFCLYQI